MLNPVFRRELNTTLRTWKTYGALTLYVLVLAIAEKIALTYLTRNYGYYNVGLNPKNISQLYTVLTVFQYILILIITPALTAGAIAGERERQTLNLMLITKLSTFKIAVGKLMSSLSVVTLLIIASMPVFALVFFYGGVSILDLIGVILYTILSSATIGSICVFLSSVFKRTVSSTVMSYITIIALCIGTIIAAVLLYAVFNYFRYSVQASSVITSYAPQAISVTSSISSVAATPTAADIPLFARVINIGLIVIFSLNPFMGFISIIDNQMGSGYLNSIFYEVNYGYQYNLNYSDYNYHIWIYNIIVNIGIIALMLFLSSRVLKPVKASRKTK